MNVGQHMASWTTDRIVKDFYMYSVHGTFALSNTFKMRSMHVEIF